MAAVFEPLPCRCVRVLCRRGFIAPCLPTNAPTPSGAEWVDEIKFDGFRVIARNSGKQVKLYSRPGNDPTARRLSFGKGMAPNLRGWWSGRGPIVAARIPPYAASSRKRAFIRGAHRVLLTAWPRSGFNAFGSPAVGIIVHFVMAITAAAIRRL